MRDATKSMQQCQGRCDGVPDKVCDALLDSLGHYPSSSMFGARGEVRDRDRRAKILAPRMALEGWRFCSYFHTGTTRPAPAHPPPGTHHSGEPSGDLRGVDARLQGGDGRASELERDA